MWGLWGLCWDGEVVDGGSVDGSVGGVVCVYDVCVSECLNVCISVVYVRVWVCGCFFVLCFSFCFK